MIHDLIRSTQTRRRNRSSVAATLSLAPRTAPALPDEEAVLLRRAQAALLEAESLLRDGAIQPGIAADMAARISQLGELVSALRQRHIAAAS